jgi:Ca-activated chloride channel family protein
VVRFQHPEALYALILLVPFALAFWGYVRSRQKALKRLGEPAAVNRLLTDRARAKHFIKFVIWSLGFAALIGGIANPQIGGSFEKATRRGVDLVIALDISNSMLAEDIKPSRLERARQYVSRLLDELTGDRVGLVFFAGSSYLQMPLTTDYAAAKTFIRTASPELSPTQGTNLADAIKTAVQAMQDVEPGYRTLLIISDGEDHSEAELAEIRDLASEYASKGMVIHTAGVGSTVGGPIPVVRVGGQADFKRDRNGSIVTSRLEEGTLREIAAAGKGQYFRLEGSGQDPAAFIRKLASQEKRDFEEYVFTDYEDQFQWLVSLALALLALDFFLSERRSRWFAGWSVFDPSSNSQSTER